MPRPKLISTPEKMWELFCDYREKIWANPIVIVEQKKGNTILPKGLTPAQFKAYSNPLVEMPLRRPLTIEGFENYVEDLEVISDMGRYFANKDGTYDEYRTICSRIKREIRSDQIEGGMAGIYNPSITQRLNGLVDKSERVIYEQPLFGESQDKT